MCSEDSLDRYEELLDKAAVVARSPQTDHSQHSHRETKPRTSTPITPGCGSLDYWIPSSANERNVHRALSTCATLNDLRTRAELGD